MMNGTKDKIRLIGMCDDRRFGCFYVAMCDKIRLDKWIK